MVKDGFVIYIKIYICNINYIKAKANFSHNVFAEECTLLKNDITLLTSQVLLTESRLCSLDFNGDEILKIIRDLNMHKVHGHNDISIKMISISEKSLLKPLTLLFLNSIKSSCYPDV